MLLQWCTLKPQGLSCLAAVRFSSPVQVKSIRIFPTDAQPFAQCPDILARTEPDGFYLKVYFNAHPISQSDAKQKQKPTNELVSTVLPYAGELTEFAVDMGLDYATRLIIVQGNFESVSMAIYGDIVTDIQQFPTAYNPKPTLTFDSIPLSKPLDPSNTNDPTLLAKQILALTPDPPPLSVLIRLMYCVKPSNSDWDHPDFPYLYVDLDQDIADFDLEKACKLTTNQIPDDLSLDRLSCFAGKVVETIVPPDNDQSYYIACLLSNLASQNYEMIRMLLEKLELGKIIEPSHLDKYTLSKLVQAAANADIARHLNTGWFLDLVSDVRDQYAVDPETKSDAERLLARIHGWHDLEDALSNTQADFHSAAALLKEAGTHELAFGVWLQCMISHPDIFSKLAENPVLPLPLPNPPLLLKPSLASISHDDFIAFLRAYIGVSCVIAVYAWSDSLPNVRCRERTLAILRLWQGVNGYREIVNHLLRLPQMTFHLESMVDNDPPTRQGIDAESILVNLAHDPQAVLSPDLVQCLFSLKQPLSYITEVERLTMRKIAAVSEDGLSTALQELTNVPETLESIREVRVLRVALAVIDVEFEAGKREWEALRTLWSEGCHGLVFHLTNVSVVLSRVLKKYFGLDTPPHFEQEFMNQLFNAANETLQLFNRLLPSYPPPARTLRNWATSVADLFACTDAADIVLSQSSSACAAAQEARQTCIDSMRMISLFDDSCEARNAPEVIFRALLLHSLQPGGFDPAYHLLQVSCLLDYLIPFPDPDVDEHHTYAVAWFHRVVPTILHELRSFILALDPENKAHFVKRLVNVDNGAIGIGEWLLLEDMKYFPRTLDPVKEELPYEARRYQAMLVLRLIRDLVVPSSSVSRWCISFIDSSSEAAQFLSSCFRSLLFRRLVSHDMTEIAQTLASHSMCPDEGLRSAVCLTLLRSAQLLGIDYGEFGSSIDFIRELLKHISNSEDEVRVEVLAFIASLDPLAITDPSVANMILQIVEWLTDRSCGPVPLLGSNEAHVDSLFTQLRNHVSVERIDDIRALVLPSEDMMIENPAIQFLPAELHLSLTEIEQAFLAKYGVDTISTPPMKPQGDDVHIGVMSISPSTILRSPLVTGLTKTYLKNDFRQLRQTSAARQNTSRLPSMHVDDFELSAASLSPVLRPVVDASTPSKANIPTDAFQSLSPAFSP